MHVGDPYRRTTPGVAPVVQAPLRPYGLVAQILIGVVIATDVWIIGAVHGQRSIIDRISGSGTVTHAEADDADHAASIASTVSTVALLVAGIAFVVWFWRVRRTAGEYSPDTQRRSQPWAFWGWVCPIVNLWFPFQIAADAMDSVPSRTDTGLGLLRWWWAAWLVSTVFDRIVAAQDPTTISALRTQTTVETVAAVLEIAGGVLAILVVTRISRHLDGAAERLTGAVIA